MKFRIAAWVFFACLAPALTLTQPGLAEAGGGKAGALTGENKSDKKKKHKKSKDKKNKKDENQGGAEKPRHRHSPGWIPSWLPENEKGEWKEGHPPGWSGGVKSDALPPGHEKWNPAQRAQWDKGLATSRDRLEEWMKGRPTALPDADRQSAQIALEAGIRHGIPPSACVDVVQSALEKGYKPAEIGQMTRAWADGERQQVNSDLLHSFIFGRVQRKMISEDIALDVYEEIETRREAAAKKP